MEMKRLYCVFIFLSTSSLHSCNQVENECVLIEKKQQLNGSYYFYWNNEDLDFYENNESASIPDQFKSGEINQEIYEKYSVGDIYCP